MPHLPNGAPKAVCAAMNGFPACGARARISVFLSLTLIVFLAFASPAHAHRLIVFATVIGSEISGTVYFAGGIAAGDVPVTLLHEDGTVVEATQSDLSGAFSFQEHPAQDYVVRADSRDGHRAEFRIAADRFAQTAMETGEQTSGRVQNEALPNDTVGDGTQVSANLVGTAQTVSPVSDAQLERAVARQLAPLQMQIDALQNTLWVRDVLGGAGMLLGVFGLWALFARKTNAEKTNAGKTNAGKTNAGKPER